MNKLKFFSIAAVVAIIDQATKFIVQQHIPENKAFFITSWFQISNFKNTGSVVGLLQNNNIIFAFLTGIIITGIIFAYKKIPNHTLPQTGFALLLGGASGNFIDRVFFGGVTDFINFSFWPAFNIADSALTISVVILLYYFYIFEKTTS